MSLPEESPDVTILLRAAKDGDSDAANQVFNLVYDDLYSRAVRHMRDQPANHTLQPTALVSEAYLKMVKGSSATLSDRRHFLARAAQIMRCVLVDHARGKNRLKRKAGERRVPLEHATVHWTGSHEAGVLDLDEALSELAEFNEIGAQLVELRNFGGMTVEEAAEVLGTSKRTAERKWQAAKAWLKSRLVP